MPTSAAVPGGRQQQPHQKPDTVRADAVDGCENPLEHSKAAGSGLVSLRDTSANRSSPEVNLWKQAFSSLEPDKKDILHALGFDKNSGTPVSDISDLVQAVNDKQKQVEEKQWGLTVKGERVVFRRYTQQIVGWLTKAGDIAVQFAPPQANVPWAVLKGLMKLTVLDSEQMHALLQVTERVVRVMNRGIVYESVYLRGENGMIQRTKLETMSDQLLARLAGIYTTALDVLAETAILFEANTFKRTILSLYNQKSVASGLDEIDKQESQLILDVRALESRCSKLADDDMTAMLIKLDAPITRMSQGVALLVKHMDEENRISMLERISSAPFGKHHYEVVDNRTPGTGQWILQHVTFQHWEIQKSSIFLLQGTAGIGKTYLTSTVIDHLSTAADCSGLDEGFAYFYCNENDQIRTQPLAILQSYVRQLATPINSPEAVQIALQVLCDKTRTKGSQLQYDQCKTQIIASINIYQRTTLVIDALDQCDPRSADRLIATLNEIMTESVKPVRIFLSSRPDPKLKFKEAMCLRLEPSLNEGDIKEFLEARLEELIKEVPSIASIREDVISNLLRKCQGMFRYAAIHISQIEECKTKFSVEELLEKTPEGIVTVYDELWTRIELQKEPDRTLSKRAIYWSLCAVQPLTSAQLLVAIRVTIDNSGCDDAGYLEDPIDGEALLTLCKDFCVMDVKHDAWQIAHPSMKSYLEKKLFYVAHNEIALVLLWLLDHAKIGDEEQPGWPRVGTVDQVDVLNTSHFLQIYAVLNLDYYRMRLSNEPRKTFVAAWERFMFRKQTDGQIRNNSKFENWVMRGTKLAACTNYRSHEQFLVDNYMAQSPERPKTSGRIVRRKAPNHGRTLIE